MGKVFVVSFDDEPRDGYRHGCYKQQDHQYHERLVGKVATAEKPNWVPDRHHFGQSYTQDGKENEQRADGSRDNRKNKRRAGDDVLNVGKPGDACVGTQENKDSNCQ